MIDPLFCFEDTTKERRNLNLENGTFPYIFRTRSLYCTVQHYRGQQPKIQANQRQAPTMRRHPRLPALYLFSLTPLSLSRSAISLQPSR